MARPVTLLCMRANRPRRFAALRRKTKDHARVVKYNTDTFGAIARRYRARSSWPYILRTASPEVVQIQPTQLLS